MVVNRYILWPDKERQHIICAKPTVFVVTTNPLLRNPVSVAILSMRLFFYRVQ